MYNYADDNTMSFIHRKLAVLISVVESENEEALEWFDNNQMQANPGKFQAIATGSRNLSELKSFNVADNAIGREETVKLLGVELDYQLNFNEQVSRTCQKVAKQLNALQRISKFLSEESRLLAFKSLIRSNFCNCRVVWHFCSKNWKNTDRRMAENGFAPPPREFCRHILSCRELKAESFKRCLHSVLRGVSL